MPYGLRLLNQDSDTQIDETYRNMQVIAEGTLSWPSTGALGTKRTVSFPACSSPPLVFVRTFSGYVGLYSLTYSGGTYTEATFMQASLGTSYGVDYMIIAPGDTYGGSSYGMRVMDANGQKVFDSNVRYLKIADVITIQDMWQEIEMPSDGTKLLSHASVANPMYALNGMRGVIQAGDAGPQVGMNCILSVDNSHCRICTLPTTGMIGNWINSPFDPPYRPQPMQLIVGTK